MSQRVVTSQQRERCSVRSAQVLAALETLVNVSRAVSCSCSLVLRGHAPHPPTPAQAACSSALHHVQRSCLSMTSAKSLFTPAGWGGGGRGLWALTVSTEGNGALGTGVPAGPALPGPTLLIHSLQRRCVNDESAAAPAKKAASREGEECGESTLTAASSECARG